jgi:hypothetical protein
VLDLVARIEELEAALRVAPRPPDRTTHHSDEPP